jgi:hypothetical protein
MMLATSLTRGSQLYNMFLNDLLEYIAAIGDAKKQIDAEVSALTF